MNFIDVIKDIHKLVGLELNSIRPGAKITITDVDEERGSLILRTSSGQNRSRPIDELQKIWNEMMVKPAVHVEGVLHGSGTSRNQPETILANLPYVEWLKVDNKKHIAYVGKNTHAFGTLRKMDSVLAVDLISKMKLAEQSSRLSTIIVSKDINNCIQEMLLICPGTVSTIEKGAYQLKTQNDYMIFLAADIWGVEEGTYCVVESKTASNMAKRVFLYGKFFSILSNNGIKAFILDT